MNFLVIACSQEQDTNTTAGSTSVIDTRTVTLTGTVSSQDEGLMQGVLVTVRREEDSFAITVVSDDQGRYSFPIDRLQPGSYTVGIRAAGYALPDRQSISVIGKYDPA